MTEEETKKMEEGEVATVPAEQEEAEVVEVATEAEAPAEEVVA